MALPLSGHTKILHILIGMSSAALAAAVPYPGNATRIEVLTLLTNTGGAVISPVSGLRCSVCPVSGA